MLLDMLVPGSEYRFRLPLRSWPLGREVRGEELVLRDDRRRGEVPMGECPRRIKHILPGRPQGSRNLPWDSCSIAAKKAWPPEAGGWDGGLAFARGVGGSYRARQWNQRYCQDPECQRLVHRWQATKRQRERRAAPEGRQKHAEAERARRQRSPGQNSSSADGDLALIRDGFAIGRVVTQQATLSRTCCATGLAVTSLRAILVERRRRIAATPVARRYGG